MPTIYVTVNSAKLTAIKSTIIYAICSTIEPTHITTDNRSLRSANEPAFMPTISPTYM